MIFAFVWSFVAFFFFPSFPIVPFVPFLALVSLKLSFSRALFATSASGFILDLFSADPFGMHALSYALVTLCCFSSKRRFSLESPLQYSLYTAFFSLVLSIIQIALLFLFDRRLNFQGKWWISEWVFLPFFDALYAFVWFGIPLACFRFIHKTWTHFWLKRQNSQN